MASSVLLVLLVATLAVSAGASRPDPELEPQPQPPLPPQEQQPSYPSSSSSCDNKLGVDALICALAREELLQVRDKCCNELGKCGKFICPTVKEVADSIPLLQGMCGNYDACSAGTWWNDQTSEEDASTIPECKLVLDPKNGCKAAVEALKEKLNRN